MKQTPMQDLREDLILTQTSAKEALLEIENQETRKACQEVVRLTLSNIIKRIDEELLEMEKQQQGYSKKEVLKAQQAILCNIKDALMNENYIIEYLNNLKTNKI